MSGYSTTQHANVTIIIIIIIIIIITKTYEKQHSEVTHDETAITQLL
jgi:hypothetical protein